MRRILVVYYSQSGQLPRVLRSMLAPVLAAPDVEVTWWEIKPIPAYPFPWPVPRFLDVFPEAVLMVPPAIEPLPFDPAVDFDVIILGYTVWYLSPAPPISAFLQSPAAEVLRGRPVVTVVNGRDKWLSAQEKVKTALRQRGARLVDNAAFIHAGNPFQHTVTTLRWMWTGRKEAFGRFPAAGISEADIRNAERFGHALLAALRRTGPLPDQPMLSGLGAVHVDADTILQEEIAHAIFTFWARRIRAASRLGRFARGFMLLLFGACLVILLLIAAPIVIFYRLLVAPFRRAQTARKIAYYEAPSGSSTTNRPDLNP